MTFSTVTTPNGARLAYVKRLGRSPTVVFLGGFRSDMTGTKATALDQWCQSRGQAYLRFDYQGHGQSSGDFVDGGIGVWSRDALHAVTALTEGPVILVGSSMGGWVMALLAREIPERIAAMVGIAVAPNFTEAIMLPNMSEQDRATLDRDGVLMVPSQYDPEPYPITKGLIEDGARHDVLSDKAPVNCPVRLIHGLEDPDVPWQMSVRLAGALNSSDVEVVLLKDGDHRLSKPHELERTLQLVAEMVD